MSESAGETDPLTCAACLYCGESRLKVVRRYIVLSGMSNRKHHDGIGADGEENTMCWAAADPKIHLAKIVGKRRAGSLARREAKFPSHGRVRLCQRAPFTGFHLFDSPGNRGKILLLSQGFHCPLVGIVVDYHVHLVRERMFNLDRLAGVGVYFPLQVVAESCGHTTILPQSTFQGQSSSRYVNAGVTIRGSRQSDVAPP